MDVCVRPPAPPPQFGEFVVGYPVMHVKVTLALLKQADPEERPSSKRK
jgi:hypothetical protein